MIAVLIALVVFVTSAAVDYAHAQYARHRDAGRAVVSALWGVGQWAATSVGFVVAVRVSLWYLPCEAIGLATGTFIAVRRMHKPEQVAITKSCSSLT